jgi:hypothetical protein
MSISSSCISRKKFWSGDPRAKPLPRASLIQDEIRRTDSVWIIEYIFVVREVALPSRFPKNLYTKEAVGVSEVILLGKKTMPYTIKPWRWTPERGIFTLCIVWISDDDTTD